MTLSRGLVVVLGLLSGCGGGSAEHGNRPAAPPPASGSVLFPNAIERKLVAGVREPPLSIETREQLVAQGNRQPVIMVKMCIDDRGVPNLLEVLG